MPSNVDNWEEGENGSFDEANPDSERDLDDYDNSERITSINLDDEPTSPTRFGMRQTQEGGKRGEEHVPISRSAYTFTACAVINSLTFGYEIGINTGAAKLIQDDLGLTSVELEVYIGSFNIFAMIGTIFAHFLSDSFGRRRALQTSALCYIIGYITMASSLDYLFLMVGRAFLGLGLGLGIALDTMYIAEISPACHRGYLVSWSHIAQNIGILFGFSSGLIFLNMPDNVSWRWMFGMGSIFPGVLIALGFLVFPESPRWLVLQGRHVEASKVLAQIYPEDFDVEVIVKDIRERIDKEEEANRATGWDVILFPTPAIQSILVVGIGIAIAEQATGIAAIQYFLAFLIEETGITAKEGQIGVLIGLGILKLVFTAISGQLLDVIGRRKLLFVSLAGMAFSLLLLSVNFLVSTRNTSFAVFGIALYLSFYSVGMGPAAWLVSTEILPTSIRSKSLSVATFSNRVVATLVSSTFFSLAYAISWAGFFLLMAAVCLVVLMFVWIQVPETKGRPLEDMTLHFAELTGDQNFLGLENNLAEMKDTIEMTEAEMAYEEGNLSGTMA